MVTVSRRLTEIDADRIAGLSSLGFAIGLPVAFSVAQLIRVEPLLIATDAAEIFKLGLVYVLLALPFFATGLAVAALLDRYAEQAPRLYAADLIGAGLGSFLALGCLGLFGSRGALAAGAFFGAAGAMAFTRGPVRIAGLATGLGLLVLAPFASDLLPLHISRAKVTRSGVPFAKVLRDPRLTKETEETSIARVDLVDFGRGGKRLMIDAGVAAVRVPPDGFTPQPSDATLPYELRPNGRVLVVGSGAGWEVAEALAFSARHVDAVEINPLILQHVPPGIASNPKVSMILDEGRSFLERQQRPYDAIVMIHTISNAATSAGALHLAEDYLLTVEAMRAALAHLDERGYLFITRPEAQLPRLLTTIVEALDVKAPAKHVAAWVERRPGGRSFYAAVLASPSPIPEQDRDEIEARIRERSLLSLVAAPGQRPADPLYRGILEKEPRESLEKIAGVRLDVPTDDRPFFHQRRRFSDLSLDDLKRALSAQSRARMALEDQPLAELSALVLLLETTAIGGLLLLLPLFLRPRQEARVHPRRLVANLAYYSALGLGFMLIEVALIQRLGLLLGRPAVAFATVFAGLLVGAGLGSRFSERLAVRKRAPLFAAGTALVLAFVVPALVHPFLGLAEAGRVLVALAVVLPTGLVLGMPFPLGLLESHRGAGGRLVPWAFAANGIASISGTVLALVLATQIGFSGVLVAAAALYGIARVAFVRLASD